MCGCFLFCFSFGSLLLSSFGGRGNGVWGGVHGYGGGGGEVFHFVYSVLFPFLRVSHFKTV